MPPRGNAPQPSVFQTDVQRLLHQKGIELYNGLAPLRFHFAGGRLTILANIANLRIDKFGNNLGYSLFIFLLLWDNDSATVQAPIATTPYLFSLSQEQESNLYQLFTKQ